MMQDWNVYRDVLLERVGSYAEQSPDVLRGLMTINNAAAKTGRLEPKIHELIALAVAVTTRCDGGNICSAESLTKVLPANDWALRDWEKYLYVIDDKMSQTLDKLD